MVKKKVMTAGGRVAREVLIYAISLAAAVTAVTCSSKRDISRYKQATGIEIGIREFVSDSRYYGMNERALFYGGLAGYSVLGVGLIGLAKKIDLEEI